MVNGISASNYQAYQNDIKNNNLKHNLTTGAVALTGGTALVATDMFADSKIVKTIDKGLTKSAEFLANGGLKTEYNKAANYIKDGYMGFKTQPPKAYEILGKTNDGFKTIAEKAKGSLINVWNGAKSLTKNILNKFAKLPAKYKVGGAIAALTIMLIEAITLNKAYNKGKIDAQYGK